MEQEEMDSRESQSGYKQDLFLNAANHIYTFEKQLGIGVIRQAVSSPELVLQKNAEDHLVDDWRGKEHELNARVERLNLANIMIEDNPSDEII